MRTAVAALLFSGALTTGAFAGEFPVGSKLDAIAVMDQGAATNIKPSAAKATAVVFTSTNCPVSNAYNERFNELYKDYASKGIQFAFVNSNASETPADIEAHSKAKGFTFRVYKDVDNVLADKLNAQYTPEVFLFDSKGTLVYHGRIDNSRELPGVNQRDTRAALDAILSGSAVPTSETKAFGCAIKRAKRTS